MSDATAVILQERGSRYGRFMDHADLTQGLKHLVREHRPEGQAATNYSCMKPDQQEAVDMILHKLGRIVNGDPDYIDSWDDIAGYARLVADRLRGEAK